MANSSLKSKPDAAIQVLLKRLGLSPRRAEVLHWIAEGKTNHEISLILECSFFTVKNHIKGIYQQLGVHSRVGAAACAYRLYASSNEAAVQDVKAEIKPKKSARRKPAKRRA